LIRQNTLCGAALLFLLTCSVRATPITFQFSGTVRQVPVDEVFGDINEADDIQGSYTFDSSAMDLVPDIAVGSFTSPAPFGMQVTIGNHYFAAQGLLNIGVLNASVDQYTVLAQSAAGDISLELFLQDNTGTVFANDHLPTTPPQLASFAEKDFHLDAFFADREVQADGQINSLFAAPEPDPATLVLGGLLVLLGMASRKRRA
jgi:hypothetical protein